MPADSVAQRAYEVAVETSELKWEQLGPLFARYTVRLTGRVDVRWSDQYRRVTADSPSFCRYHLDPKSGTISFTCRATDGPKEVLLVVKRLVSLVDSVNERACLAGSRESEDQASVPEAMGVSRSK